MTASKEPQEDWAWYALRNVIFAFGCRIRQYKKESRATWHEAQDKSWQYFENAMSVHTEILYSSSESCGVEALLMMVTLDTCMGVTCINMFTIVTFCGRHWGA